VVHVAGCMLAAGPPGVGIVPSNMAVAAPVPNNRDCCWGRVGSGARGHISPRPLAAGTETVLNESDCAFAESSIHTVKCPNAGVESVLWYHHSYVLGGERAAPLASFSRLLPYTLLAKFDDKTQQTIDFEPILAGELLGPLQDPALFNRVELDQEVHTLTWPNGADFDPATLHDWSEQSDAMKEHARQWESA
jgi:hypothetical protein